MTATKKRTNIRLTMLEDYVLAKWLHEREMKSGEQIADVVKEAKDVLKIEKINYNHVQQRMQEFGIKLVPSAAPTDELTKVREQLEVLQHRVYALEQVVAALRSAQVQGK